MQILFTNARVVDATLAEPVEGHVLVEDGIVRDLHARPIAAADRMVLDLKGRTLMPGLIDCHVHVVASMMNLGANAQLPDAMAVLSSLADRSQNSNATAIRLPDATFAVQCRIHPGHVDRWPMSPGSRSRAPAQIT